MAKFNVKVTRVDEYEIDVNWTEEEIKTWSEIFSPAEGQEDIAKHLALSWMREEDKWFKEGWGYVKEFKTDGEIRPIPFRDDNGKFVEFPSDKYCVGISIKPIRQDEDYETEVSEVV